MLLVCTQFVMKCILVGDGWESDFQKLLMGDVQEETARKWLGRRLGHDKVKMHEFHC